MSTMIRLTVSLLIVSLLTLNIAWAVDECAFTDPGQAGLSTLLADDQPPADPTNAGLNCDDWCLAWVSQLAPMTGGVLEAHITAIINDGALLVSYSSLPIPPSLQPPIA
jgi:hypothetical protein